MLILDLKQLFLKPMKDKCNLKKFEVTLWDYKADKYKYK